MTIDASPVDGLLHAIRGYRAHRMPSPEQQRFDTALEELAALARSAPTFDVPFADDVLERIAVRNVEGLHFDADQELALLLYRHAQDAIEAIDQPFASLVVDPVGAAVARVVSALQVIYGVARVVVSSDGVNAGGSVNVPAGVTLVLETTGPDVEDMSFVSIAGPHEGEIPAADSDGWDLPVSVLNDVGEVVRAGTTDGSRAPNGDVWVKVTPSFRPGMPYDLCSYPDDRLRYEAAQ